MRPFRSHSMFSFVSESGRGGSPNRLPMLTRPSTARNNFVAGLGEFVGTFLFLFFGFIGVQIAHTPPPTTPAGGGAAPPNVTNLIFIALVFGMSLMVNVWAF